MASATAEQTWAVVSDFCRPWHPAIQTMTAETTQQGELIRQFEIKGEETTYRERLTFYSDSDREMAYTHIQGVKGVTDYNARLKVSETADGATVEMSAEISAPSPRLEEIAAGTKAIFDDGTAVIAKLASSGLTPSKAARPILPARPINAPKTIVLDGPPRLALSSTGTQNDTLCLFLHGIGGNRSNWNAQLAAIAPHFRAAALDLRGYGGSDLGATQSTVAEYCSDILRVMEAFQAKRLILCGLSYGAWIATSFAMRHPDKLAALVVSGGCTGMSEASAEERNAFQKSRERPLREGQTPADFAPAVVQSISGPNATEKTRAALLASMQAIPAKTYADALSCFTNPPEAFDFSKIAVPVLLMTGAHDKLAPPAEIKQVSRRIWEKASTPDVRFEVIPEAGHVCNLEDPETYNRILSDFVSRIRA